LIKSIVHPGGVGVVLNLLEPGGQRVEPAGKILHLAGLSGAESPSRRGNTYARSGELVGGDA